MRTLFLILLVCNLIYFAWAYSFADKKEVIKVEKQINSEYPTLVLLNQDENAGEIDETEDMSEYEDYEEWEDESGDEGEEVNVLARLCYSIGPFFEEDSVNNLLAVIEEQGYSISTKSITDAEPKSYWVHIPPFADLDEAKKVAKELKAAKIKDYFVVLKGENQKAISLGLFNSHRRAMIRKENLAEKGFEAHVITRYEDVTRHWLDYVETEIPLADEVWNENGKNKVLQKIPRPC